MSSTLRFTTYEPVLINWTCGLDDEDEDDDDAPEVEDRTESPTRVLPKQPGEFVCQSCFLVKHPSQLADADAQLCRDCV